MNYLRKIILSTASRSRRKCTGLQNFLRNNRRYSSDVTVDAIPQISIPRGIYGQPTCHTHPHMISPDHLTCGITQSEYKERRGTLVHKLVMEKLNPHTTHIIVIPGARKQYMSDKIPYAFRQNSDFFYLTGCLEPSAVLVIVKPAQTDYYKSILFLHDKDSHAEQWEGPRTGCAAAPKLFAVDEARPVENFNVFLKKTATSSKPVTFWYHTESPANPDLHPSISQLINSESALTLADPINALHLMRVIKSPAEVELLKDVCHLGAQSVNMAMACTKPGMCESAIHAVIEYSSRLGGAEYLSFPPVIGGGARAAHIHYVANNQLLADGEMVLVDTGSQRWLYNSDISRTWPVNGKFSPHQLILYEIVLTVQKRLIEILAEYRPSLDTLFDHMCRLLGKHLQEEGIFPKHMDDNELASRAYRVCPHHVSHYLGLDVHDAPRVLRQRPVAPGMLVTVEPGIYIRADDDSIPIEFRGVGIRVEDDVLVTDTNVEVLTKSCVKEVADIQAIVGKHSI